MKTNLILFFSVLLGLWSCAQVNLYDLANYREVNRGVVNIEGIPWPNVIVKQNINDTNYAVMIIYEDSLFTDTAAITFYFKQIPHGPSKSFVNGRVYMEGSYKNGKRDGKRIIYGDTHIRRVEFFDTPNALYLRQGTAEEKMLGAYVQVKATSGELLLGANYRFNDAVSPFIGYTYNNFVLGASYDVNSSDLGKMTRGGNAFEISLSFFGRKKASTPEVEFICPAL